MEQDQAKFCYVALGSNLGDSLSYLQSAASALSQHEKIAKLETSRVYQSKPHGPQDQPDYFNAAVSFETTLESEALLDVLQSVENTHQRERENMIRWGARTLDLDLLFYAEELIHTKRLSVPHPRICERAFVLLPLKDLEAESLKVNENDTISDCIDRLPEAELQNCVLVKDQLLRKFYNERNENG